MPLPLRAGGFLLLHTRALGKPGKGIGRVAAEHLVRLGVSLVGTDHSGIDNTRNRDRPGHMVLLGGDVLLVEGLVNLDRLVGREVLFVCAPLALQGGTGSPVRPFAVHPCPEVAWPVVAAVQRIQ
jgi:kynurenine formamidase